MITNKEKNFASAVVYLHNCERDVKAYLGAINETFKENFEKYEIVCVNDCSTDGTLKAVNGFCDEESVKSLTLVNTSFFQGTENGMIAGDDIAIGDFVFEFDSTFLDFEPKLIMEVYKKSLEGNDIVFAVPQEKMRLTSKLFYKLFNSFSEVQYKLRTQRFSVISRRGINRVKSMGVKTVYRKAVYASCGLKVSDVSYEPTAIVAQESDRQRQVKKGLAANSLILFTDIAYKLSITLSIAMSVILLAAGVYTIAVFFSATPVAGWTTTMLVMSFGFFGLFLLLAFVLKYLSVILNLVFTHKQYVIESIQKITR
ncbi:MAG: glycosyltransferase [Oscillospiraceae bacterium]